MSSAMFRCVICVVLLVVFAGFTRTRATTTESYDIYQTEAWTEGENSSGGEQSTTKTVERKWISQIFDEVQETFRMHANVSERCRRDYTMYETYLRNQTIWAVRMMESSEWPRRGLFNGMTTVLGGWTECLGVRSPAYRGQYCLVDAVYDYSFVEADPIQRGWDRPANPNSSVWGVIKMFDTIVRRTSRRNLTWALCIPSSCTWNDLQISVMNAASPIFRKYDVDFAAYVTPTNCRVDESKPVSEGFRYTLCFVLFLTAVVLLATYWDYDAHIVSKADSTDIAKESYTKKAFYSFSLLETWKCLTNSSSETISSLYFAKSVLAVLIVIAHEGFVAIPFPKLEQEDAELIYRPWEIFLGFHACVDVFVGISGFLTFHFGYDPTKKIGILYFVGSLIFRWIRLIPVWGLLALVYIFMIPEMGDGPLWNRRMLYEFEACKSNWWTNMLAIQNIVNRQDMCLPHTWYVAVDFQLTVLGSAILVIMAKNFKLGIASMIVTFVTGMGAHFYTIYANGFTGLPVEAVIDAEIMRKVPVFSDLYIQSYARIGPYMVGFTGALLLRVLKKRKYHPSTTTSWLIVLWTLFIGAGSMSYGLYFFILGRPYEVIENAIYGPLTRTLIAVPIVTIIVLHSLRRMGWFSYVIGWKLFMVVGRLVYCVYLVSFTIQFYRVSTMRQVLTGSNHVDLAYGIMVDVCLTVMSSVLLFVLAEGPIHNLTILLLNELNERKKKSDALHQAMARDQMEKLCGQSYGDNVHAKRMTQFGRLMQ